MNRENAMREAKLASIRKQSIVNDAKLNREYAKSMEHGSRKLALAIVRTGKAHGPVNEAELIEYVRPLVKNAVQTIVDPRKAALEAGKKHYIGTPHSECGRSLRFTASYLCVYCNSTRLRADKERGVAADLLIADMASANGVTVEQLVSPSRLGKYAKCRREIWSALVKNGFSYRFIGKKFNRTADTVWDTLNKTTKKSIQSPKGQERGSHIVATATDASNENAALGEIAA